MSDLEAVGNENRAALVRRLAGMPVGAGNRSEEKGTEAAMRPRPSAPRGERENAAMGDQANCGPDEIRSAMMQFARLRAIVWPKLTPREIDGLLADIERVWRA